MEIRTLEITLRLGVRLCAREVTPSEQTGILDGAPDAF